MTERARALSFGAVSHDYDRFRPGPPAAVLDWLLPDGARDAVDLGAGTGALTGLLAERAARVTAVEPDGRMRAVLAASVPAATVRAGTAERLPLDDASQDAVLVSSAWHWMKAELAVPEAARVLRPGGALGVLWTSIDRDDDAARELWAALRPRQDSAPAQRDARRLEIPPTAKGAFGAVEGPHVVRFARRFTLDDLVGLAGTYSAVIALPQDERARLLDGVRSRFEADLRFAQSGGIELPMASRCFRARRTGGAAPSTSPAEHAA